MMKFMLTIGAVALLLMPAGCREKNQPAETGTIGNATDRSADGTTGTGQPASVATDTTAAAQSLGTVAPSKASTGTVAITGTEEVHAASTETTSTIHGPGGTSTAAVATPTDTSATIKTSTGTVTGKATKKK